jgi:hypothetical protein
VLEAVNELRTCEYQVVVLSASVCGDPRFKKARPAREQDNTEALMETEDWYLEIAHVSLLSGLSASWRVLAGCWALACMRRCGSFFSADWVCSRRLHAWLVSNCSWTMGA